MGASSAGPLAQGLGAVREVQVDDARALGGGWRAAQARAAAPSRTQTQDNSHRARHAVDYRDQVIVRRSMAKASPFEPLSRRLSVYGYLAPLVDGARVLEIGTGEGGGAAHLLRLGATTVVGRRRRRPAAGAGPRPATASRGSASSRWSGGRWKARRRLRSDRGARRRVAGAGHGRADRRPPPARCWPGRRAAWCCWCPAPTAPAAARRPRNGDVRRLLRGDRGPGAAVPPGAHVRGDAVCRLRRGRVQRGHLRAAHRRRAGGGGGRAAHPLPGRGRPDDGVELGYALVQIPVEVQGRRAAGA